MRSFMQNDVDRRQINENFKYACNEMGLPLIYEPSFEIYRSILDHGIQCSHDVDSSFIIRIKNGVRSLQQYFTFETQRTLDVRPFFAVILVPNPLDFKHGPFFKRI